MIFPREREKQTDILSERETDRVPDGMTYASICLPPSGQQSSAQQLWHFFTMVSPVLDVKVHSQERERERDRQTDRQSTERSNNRLNVFPFLGVAVISTTAITFICSDLASARREIIFTRERERETDRHSFWEGDRQSTGRSDLRLNVFAFFGAAVISTTSMSFLYNDLSSARC